MSRQTRAAKDAPAKPTASAQDPRVVPIRRQTMAFQIRALLRREIIDGRLPPRAALSEQELANRFGVSRTPVREALIKLSEEHLVEIYPQHGTFVAPIDLADVYDSQFVREALECAAVAHAVARVDAKSAKALEAILDRQRQCEKAGDAAGFFAADEGMHELIMDIAGHANVWRQVENAKAQMDRVRHLTMKLPRKRSIVIAEHAAVVDRVIARDREGALAAMRTHLRGIFRSIELLTNENPNYFQGDTRLRAAATARA